MKAFKYEPGCYGDGAFGLRHTLDRAIDIARENGFQAGMQFDASPELSEEDIEDILMELADAAVDYLNEHVAVEGATWQFSDGDFGLYLDSETESHVCDDDCRSNGCSNRFND